MAELKKVQDEKQKVAEFNPQANYQWDPKAQFILSGAEFDLLFKALKANLNNPVFIAHVNQFEALKLMEKTFVDGVESGVITEVPEEEKEDVNEKLRKLANQQLNQDDYMVIED